jgi:hypothetical protein
VSITLGQVITSARDQHPAFDRSRVGNALFARWQTQYQRRLVQRAIQRNRDFLLQTMSIGLAPSDNNQLEAAGAGQNREAAALDAAAGTITPAEVPAGLAIELTVTATDVADTVATSATATTLTKSAAGWVVNAYLGKVVQIIRGTGAGQWRYVQSNTSDTLTISNGSDNYEWSTVPDTTSIFRIVTASADTTRDFGAVADFPLLRDSYGYMVKLTAAGVPFIDLTAPVIAQVAVGVPLPPHHLIRGGTVHLNDGEQDHLTITSYGHRLAFPEDYSVYVQDGELFLCGQIEAWVDVRSIDLKYVPIPPALTSLESLYIVPDSAESTLIAAAALEAAKRVSNFADVAIDVEQFQLDAAQAEHDFMLELSAQRRSRKTIIKG